MPGISKEEIFNEVNKKKSEHGMFQIVTANERLKLARLLPDEKPLFDELWYENELCILFSETGKGKTFLAMQAAEVIATAKTIGGFSCCTGPKKVLYYDFELSHKQFEKRYKHYTFSDDFIIACPSDDGDFEFKNIADFENKRFDDITKSALKYKVDVIIIDNLTWVNSESEKGNVSGKFMQKLRAFQKKYQLSVLVISHTPKRKTYSPLELSDLYGSIMLSAFSDSVVAIGESTQGEDVRYIKQIKVRSERKTYHQNNILVCRMTNINGMTCYEIINTGNEYEHLNSNQKNYSNKNEDLAVKLKEEGKSVVEIAKELGVTRTTVYNYFKKGKAKNGLHDEKTDLYDSDTGF
jgi:RecA-family ATPase